MRNPLSALIGCADEIITSLGDYRNAAEKSLATTALSFPSITSKPEISKSFHLLDEAIEAADTIIYCAMHQKRIIDDILTLSKLDSKLVLVCPEPAQPIQLVRRSLKIFEAELKRAEIKLDLIEQDSLKKLRIEWTLLDPSRLLQVLINLMTNAIKFTRTEDLKHIIVTMGASISKPSESNRSEVHYVGKGKASLDQTSKPEWGNGDVVYLSIKVEDTGKGLSKVEIKNLFHLFAQANPKTHQTYGGSGLGLFISRQLVEMQGGEIGVASEAGKGSTFQFYVKTRRTNPPTGPQERTHFQPLLREDALREACAVEIQARQPGVTPPKVGPETSRALSPAHSLPQNFHILVVEDNLVNQKVVAKQLRKLGHTVSVANHGEEALAFIRRSEYWDEIAGGEKLSVILMDLEMPVMDGLSCVKRIRELQTQGKIKGHVPVIAVTANARLDQITISMNAGMVCSLIYLPRLMSVLTIHRTTWRQNHTECETCSDK
jgi:signal transduction histidine kinase